jgi:hypothetical protein
VEITIEVCGPNNERAKFIPTSEMLRGRWRALAIARFDTHSFLKQLMSRVSEIPGICLAIDVEKAIGRRFDPLKETAEGRKIWKDVESILKEFESNIGAMRPWPEARYERMGPDQIKSWLYYMRRMIDGKKAVYAFGSQELPTIQQIAELPGRRMMMPSSYARKEGDRWADSVPVGAAPAMAGSGSGGGGRGGKQSSTRDQE